MSKTPLDYAAAGVDYTRIDIAMAINNLITVGATPLSIHAYWSAGSSMWFSDTERMEDLVRGWKAACDVCRVSWGGGETPALGGVEAGAKQVLIEPLDLEYSAADLHLRA